MNVTVFENFTRETVYTKRSKTLVEKHQAFPRYRRQQIENEWELIDLHDKGSLSEAEICSYFINKYQWINSPILSQLFISMKKDSESRVSKDQFVTKYLDRERKLYSELNGLRFYNNWVSTIEGIISESESSRSTPCAYLLTQIKEVDLYKDQQKIEWMDIEFNYENHSSKVEYTLLQCMHEAGYPSFQVWLPALDDTFFLRVKFSSCEDSSVYGQAYVNFDLNQKIKQFQDIDLSITRNGNRVGNCRVTCYVENELQRVHDHLSEARGKREKVEQLQEEKLREYEYLQFLMGVRHRHPHKIEEVDVGWMLACRTVLLVLVGCLGLVVHVLGRFEPLSIIVAILMLRTWGLVLLRSEKFLLTCLNIAAMFLDIIWIAVCSGEPNQINFTSSQGCSFATYALLAVKMLLLVYFILVEKSLVSD